MLDFDFDVVTGPSKASCPAVPDEPVDEEKAGRNGDGVPAEDAGERKH